MKNCPICYHPLPDMVAGKRQICTFCGWVNQSHQSKGNKVPLKHYTALSPEDIARQQIQNAESPVLSLVLTGLGLLVIIFLSIQGLRHSQQAPLPPPVAKTLPPEPTPSPSEPTPVPTFMAVPTPVPEPSVSPTQEASTSPSPETGMESAAASSLAATPAPELELSPPPLPSAQSSR